MGILVLKCVISLAQKSLNLLTEPDSKLLYQVRVDPRKVMGKIFQIESLS